MILFAMKKLRMNLLQTVIFLYKLYCFIICVRNPLMSHLFGLPASYWLVDPICTSVDLPTPSEANSPYAPSMWQCAHHTVESFFFRNRFFSHHCGH